MKYFIMSSQLLIRRLYKLKYVPFKPHTSVCLYSSSGFKQSQKLLQVEDRWKKTDTIPKEYELIYKAPWDTYVAAGTTFLTVTTPTILLAVLNNVLSNPDMFLNWDNPITIADNLVIAGNLYEMSIYLGAFIAVHSMLKIVITRYVLRIYKNEKNYVAVCRGHWFNSIVKHKFDVEQFAVGSRSLFFGDAVFKLGRKRVLIMEKYFKTPHYLNVLLKLHKNDENNN